MLQDYMGNSAYFTTDDGLPFVSIFEGPDNAHDWTDIKSTVSFFSFLIEAR
jgi:hypothetical protein